MTASFTFLSDHYSVYNNYLLTSYNPGAFPDNPGSCPRGSDFLLKLPKLWKKTLSYGKKFRTSAP